MFRTYITVHCPTIDCTERLLTLHLFRLRFYTQILQVLPAGLAPESPTTSSFCWKRFIAPSTKSPASTVSTKLKRLAVSGSVDQHFLRLTYPSLTDSTLQKHADCYVAATGIPDPRPDHAVAMSQFALDCLDRMHVLVKKLEVHLGPDTGMLGLFRQRNHCF